MAQLNCATLPSFPIGIVSGKPRPFSRSARRTAALALQHADVVQPWFDLFWPFPRNRIGGWSHPEGMAALGVEPYVDGHTPRR